jgi:hypothetical protein
MKRFVFSQPLYFRQPRADYAVILKIADSLESKLRKAFLAAVEQLRDSVSLAALVRALEQRATLQALGLISLKAFEADFKAVAESVIHSAVAQSGAAAAGLAPKLGLRFDITNPKVYGWIATRTGELVREVSDETRSAVSGIIDRGFREGRTVKQMARDIRQLVGLTSRQAQAVENYRKRLEKEGVKPDRIAKNVERYQKKMLRLRSETLSRTETITASSRGQQLLWETNVDSGLINPSKWQRKWITTRDDRACPACLEMSGQTAPIGQQYSNGAMGPALHPSCRCAESLVEIKRTT